MGKIINRVQINLKHIERLAAENDELKARIRSTEADNARLQRLIVEEHAQAGILVRDLQAEADRMLGVVEQVTRQFALPGHLPTWARRHLLEEVQTSLRSLVHAVRITRAALDPESYPTATATPPQQACAGMHAGAAAAE